MPTNKRSCRGCDASLEHRSANARWCSETCRVGWYRDRHGDRYAANDARRRREQYEPVSYPPRPCEHCGSVFTPTRSDHRFCSKQCINDTRASTLGRRTSQARALAKTRGAPIVEHVDVEAVFERDGWRCQICGGAVDPELRYPDPESASLDHTEPVAAGGRHEVANVQLAHLDCNRRKGASTGEPQPLHA